MWKGRWRQGGHLPLVVGTVVLWLDDTGDEDPGRVRPVSSVLRISAAATYRRSRRRVGRSLLQHLVGFARSRSRDAHVVARRSVPRGIASSDHQPGRERPPSLSPHLVPDAFRRVAHVPAGVCFCAPSGPISCRQRWRTIPEQCDDNPKWKSHRMSARFLVRLATTKGAGRALFTRPSRARFSSCAQRRQCLVAARRPRTKYLRGFGH